MICRSEAGTKELAYGIRMLRANRRRRSRGAPPSVATAHGGRDTPQMWGAAPACVPNGAPLLPPGGLGRECALHRRSDRNTDALRGIREPVVIGENGVNAQANSACQMQRVEGAQDTAG